MVHPPPLNKKSKEPVETLVFLDFPRFYLVFARFCYVFTRKSRLSFLIEGFLIEGRGVYYWAIKKQF